MCSECAIWGCGFCGLRWWLTRPWRFRFKFCMAPGIDLSKLTAAEKDALILSLLPLAGHLAAALARVAELEARLARFERPGKTPDNSSLPPSKGRKPERPSSGKPLRRSRPGFGRALEANPDRVVDAMLGACPHCAAAFPAGQQTPQQVHDPGAAVLTFASH